MGRMGRRRRWWVAAGGLVLLVGCGTGPATAVTSSQRPPVSTAGASTVGPVVATAAPVSGPYVVDLTWLDVRDGWLLAQVPCATGTCSRLSATTDGGRSWHALPAPPGTDGSVGSVSHVRFATASIGYLYGPALFLTRDGGQHWTRQVGLSVEELNPAGRTVIRVAYAHGGCPGPCSRLVQEAAPGSSTWRTVLSVDRTAAELSAGDARIVRQGATVYVPVYGNLASGAGGQQVVILRSLDGGAHWRQLADPCGGSGPATRDAIDLAVARGGVVAVLCSSRSGAGPDSVVSSTDSGTRWSRPHPVPGDGLTYGLIAAADCSHLVLAPAPISGDGPYTYRVLSSSDGGRHWRSAVAYPAQIEAGAPAAGYLAFQGSAVGHWVGDPRAIWSTTDSGAHWVRQLLP